MVRVPDDGPAWAAKEVGTVVSSGDRGADTEVKRPDETVFGTPVAPWDQPEQLGDQTPGGLRPHRHAGGVHPGWASATQEAYDAAASGGWGVPGQDVTGPIPKIRRTADAPATKDGEASDQGG